MIDLLDRIIERVRRFFVKRWRRLTKLLVSNSESEKTMTRRGLLFEVDPGDDLQRIVLFEGLHNDEERRICASLLKEESVVIDVGAHVGFYTIFLSALVPSGRVHSFEPNPGAFSQLERHAEINGCDNVMANNLALGEQEGNGNLSVPDGKSGMASLSGHMHDRFSEEEVERVNAVSVITLDQYVKGKNVERIDLMKIDVEGWEPFVIQGARSALERFRPWILMEVNSLALQGQGWKPQELLDLLEEHDYEFYKSSHVLSGFRHIHADGDYGTIYDVICRPGNS